MLSAILGWIPVIGPIAQGVSNIFGAFFNTKVVALQTGAQVAIAETNASVAIIQATNNDICLRLLRDMVCLPVVIWTMIIGWDTILAYSSLRDCCTLVMAPYPDKVGYLPYAVIIFLLGNIGINTWARKV